MIPDHEISKCPEYEVKSKIGTIFVNLKKHLKNILLRIMKLVLIFMSITVIIVNLLELILVKKIMMRTMKLEEYRCLSVSLKTKKNESEIKALKDEIKKLKRQLTNEDV